MTIPQRILKRIAALEELRSVDGAWPGGWQQYADGGRERDAILDEIRALAGAERWGGHCELMIAAAAAFKRSDRGRAALDAFNEGRMASVMALVEGLGGDDANQVLRLLLRERELLLRQTSPPAPVRRA